jgi:anaphase-promoting complex subunit 8
MHFYCLYYYKKAHELRPNDSRMLVALGESYEKLNKLPVKICLMFMILIPLANARLTLDIFSYLTSLGSQRIIFIVYFKQEALKCYWKAYCVGDIEGGIALFQLARMYESTDEPDQVS